MSTATISSLSLREQVQDFHASYVRCIDADALEHWPDFFTEDCRYCVTTAENLREGLAAGLIWANNRAMLHDRVTALRHANIYEPQSYRHILGWPSILSQEADSARCETPFMVARIVQGETTSLFATGVYQDVFDLRRQPIRLLSRDVVCDSNRIDTLLALPL